MKPDQVSHVCTAGVPRRFWRSTACVIAIGALFGCGSMPAPRAGAFSAPTKSVTPIKAPDISGYAEQAISYVNTGVQQEFVLRPMRDSGEPLPNAQVRPFSFDGVAVYDVLRALIDQSGLKIGLTVDFGGSLARKLQRTAVTYRANGTLADAVAELSRSAGFFYSYRGGVLSVSSDEQFIVLLPPIPESFEGVPQMVSKLGARDVLLERSSRALTFRADLQTFERVRSYLELLRSSKSLLFYDCYIWEVQLNDSSRLGIRWQQLASALSSASGSAAAGGASIGFSQNGSPGVLSFGQGSIGTALGLSFKASNFAMSMFLDFLETQGTINNLSQPKLSMLSGGTSQFRNGTTQPYISKITGGVAVNGAVTSGGTETSTAETGLTLTITGDHSDGTIYSDISLVIKDITRFDSFTVPAGNNTTGSLSLPVIAEREVHARVRSRPGEAIIVGGINTQSVSDVAKGLGPIKTDSERSGTKSELVIVLVPKVTIFRNVDETTLPKVIEN